MEGVPAATPDMAGSITKQQGDKVENVAVESSGQVQVIWSIQ
jgi:hypothetical protein